MSSAPAHPLTDFLDLTYRRCVAAVVHSASHASSAASSYTSHAHAAWLNAAVDVERHSALLAPLTWRWFRCEWLSSGCRVLPLLAAHMQSAVVQSANSACAPPSAALQADVYRSASWPAGVMTAHVVDCYDTVTARLSQQRPSLARRVHIYYTLYCLHGCQVTTERYPIPIARHHWPLVLDDLSTLQQLPVLEPYAVLRDLLERRSVRTVHYVPPRHRTRNQRALVWVYAPVTHCL